MKLDSKSGATLAAAAATLFLAGAVVSTGVDDRERRGRQVHGCQCLQGPERLQGRREFLQGPERLQGSGLRQDVGSQVQGHGRRIRQVLIAIHSIGRPGTSMPGLLPSAVHATKLILARRVTKPDLDT